MRTEDGYMVKKCLNGEVEAFGFLIDKYRESVYALAYSMLRDFHDAQDVAQEAFLKAYKELRALRQWDSFASWLYRITINLCKGWIKVRSSHPVIDMDEKEVEQIIENQSVESYHTKLLHDSLYDSLELLPEIHRQVLTLHFFAGLTSYEISVFMGISPDAVRKRLIKARELLKEEMLDEMKEAAEEHGPKVGFTLQVLQKMKNIKINPVPRALALPWGISISTVIVITFISLFANINFIDFLNISAQRPVYEKQEFHIPVSLLPEVLVISNNKNPGNNGLQSISNTSIPDSITLKLDYDLQTTDGAFYSSPTVADGIVYTGANGNTLRAIDIDTGSMLWSYTDPERLGTASVYDDYVITGSNAGCVRVLNRYNGQLIKSIYHRNINCDSPCPVYNGIAYAVFGCGVCALRLSDGEVLWEYFTKGYYCTNPVLSKDGTKLVTSVDSTGVFICLDTSTGRVIWSRGLTGSWKNRLWVISGDRLYVYVPNKLICLNLNSGLKIWSKGGVGYPIGLSFHDGLLVAVSRSGKIYAYKDRGTDSHLLWSKSIKVTDYCHPVITGNNRVILPGKDGRIYQLDADTGSIINSIYIGFKGESWFSVLYEGKWCSYLFKDGVWRLCVLGGEERFNNKAVTADGLDNTWKLLRR